ncbi:Cytochrome c oxidase assembly protein COX11, mitochondrial [Vanrija pseudolonga]|uniref:Cytochrome c oxidase assembly protein COX11, mitochondrial n=1 Tax=Vanrija pseudolonga TaxID=143232 RepID=A0AAF1BMY1_9TREE|nr:Cytochrome c oxidase assembly protein COX11, mitochondrial [Vanrija pseudolonga]
MRPTPAISRLAASARPACVRRVAVPRFARAYAAPVPPPPPSSAASSSSAASAAAAARSAAIKAARDKMYAENMRRNRTILLYSVGALAIATGVTYAAVPAYRAFCAATGFAGTPMTDPERFSADRLYATDESKGRPITVRFEATSNDALPWSFEPQQRSVRVVPGQTALAFYTAKNNSDQDLIGIATYNMTPDKIAQYFAKVECFCFEEQKIRAGEEVDLPVFFFIDRDIVDDPTLDNVDDVVLSYTFFRARRNDRGHLEPDAPEEVVHKTLGWDKYEHAPKPGGEAKA